MRRSGLFVVLVVAATAGAATSFPALSGRVVDAAGILRSATAAELTQRLEAYERSTGRQIVVATIPDLDGLDIADYGYQLGRQWGIGAKETNTGAVLIVAPNERKVRIEVGYGLEGDLTDAMSAQIIQTRILPAFRAGNVDGGVRAGVDGIIAVLGGEAQRAAPAREIHDVLPGAIFWLFMLIMVLSSFSRRRHGRLARAVLWGAVLGGMQGGHRGGGIRGGRGGGGGGGGFRGGGGSFGGGGASGGW
jgi:uncharacterized protein